MGEWVAGIVDGHFAELPQRLFTPGDPCIPTWSLLRFLVTECFGSLGIDKGINFSRPNVSEIPMPRLSKRKQADLIETVQEIIACKRADPTASITEKEKQVDGLVYGLYGLGREEIAAVEATLVRRKGTRNCKTEWEAVRSAECW